MFACYPHAIAAKQALKAADCKSIQHTVHMLLALQGCLISRQLNTHELISSGAACCYGCAWYALVALYDQPEGIFVLLMHLHRHPPTTPSANQWQVLQGLQETKLGIDRVRLTISIRVSTTTTHNSNAALSTLYEAAVLMYVKSQSRVAKLQEYKSIRIKHKLHVLR